MNINKITLSTIVLVALLGLFLTISVVKAQEVTPNASGANGSEESAPVAVGANASEEGTPSNQGANENEAPAIIPGGQGSDENEGAGIIPNGSGANNDEVSGTDDNTPSNPSNPSNGGGNGGSGSSSRNGRSSSATSTLPLLTSIGNCLYINDYLKLDGVNNTAEVTKLQTFLKNTEKLDVDINGKFDQKTVDAVKAFQAKYVNEIMAPWGVNTPTGQVFYTTKKKINEIYCKSTFALTPAQIAQIEAYRKGIVDGTIDVNGSEVTATGTIPLLPEVGSTDASQTASVAGFGTRIWNFVKWLFGY